MNQRMAGSWLAGEGLNGGSAVVRLTFEEVLFALNGRKFVAGI